MNEQTELTIEDLGNLKTIIELACTRGAFQAAEMRTVGETYERLDAFLSSLAAQAHPQPQGENYDS
jgi:hypothetical protein